MAWAADPLADPPTLRAGPAPGPNQWLGGALGGPLPLAHGLPLANLRGCFLVVPAALHTGAPLGAKPYLVRLGLGSPYP